MRPNELSILQDLITNPYSVSGNGKYIAIVRKSKTLNKFTPNELVYLLKRLEKKGLIKVIRTTCDVFGNLSLIWYKIPSPKEIIKSRLDK